MIFKHDIGHRIKGSLGFVVLLAVLGSAAGAQEEEHGRMALLDDETPLKVGNRLAYTVVEDRQPAKILLVTDRGLVDPPYIGKVQAVGKTCKALAFEIKQLLEVDFYYRATVLLEPHRAINSRGRLTMLGEVRQQGPLLIPIDEILTVSSAILRSGGFSLDADKSRVSLLRSDPASPEGQLKIEIDVGRMLETGNFGDDVAVESEDIILVPRLEQAGGQVYIVGEINSPGLYAVPNEPGFTLSKAILMAGGFTTFANKKNVKLIRANSDLPEKERILKVNVADILEKGIRDFDPVVNPNDIVRVEARLVVF